MNKCQEVDCEETVTEKCKVLMIMKDTGKKEQHVIWLCGRHIAIQQSIQAGQKLQ